MAYDGGKGIKRHQMTPMQTKSCHGSGPYADEDVNAGFRLLEDTSGADLAALGQALQSSSAKIKGAASAGGAALAPRPGSESQRRSRIPPTHAAS